MASPHPRIARLTGRTDDMVKFRGVALYPAQIDEVLSRVDGLSSEYQIHIERQHGREQLTIRIEAAASPPPGHLAEETARAVRQALNIRPQVEVVEPGSLPRSERKSQRVFDHRGT